MLRTAGVREQITARVGRETAGALRDDGLSVETVAKGLGTTYSKALQALARHDEFEGRPGAEQCHLSPS